MTKTTHHIGNAKATIVLDSIDPQGIRLTTFEVEYPRFIHGELLTHRVFSRNSSSSRAIPINKMLEQVQENPARPVHWGKNQSGMQANEELDTERKALAQGKWQEAQTSAIQFSKELSEIGLHKQLANRVTEAFQNIKVIITATEMENFFSLRNHKDAQPEIQSLAKAMLAARENSTPRKLSHGQWHLPYVDVKYDGFDEQFFFDEFGNSIPLDAAQRISTSCCAQVSYRKSDSSLEKADSIYAKLIGSEPAHWSPFEASAMAVDLRDIAATIHPLTWLKGHTHVDRQGNFWSGNFKNWIQYRQLFNNS